MGAIFDPILGKLRSSADGAQGNQGAQGVQGAQGFQGAAGGMMSWQGAWVTATGYVVDDAVEHNGSSYICTANHTSGTASEPGVGVDWEDFWDLVAARGAQGTQGTQGVQGATGSQGNQGHQGNQGVQGSTGAQGAQGDEGAQGAQGETGAQGAQGDEGAQGATGAQGAQGTQGVAGAQGAAGAQGNQGFQGNQGTQGNQGFQGNQGTQGNQGAQGAQGAPGGAWSTAGINTQPTRNSASDPVYIVEFVDDISTFLYAKVKVKWIQNSITRFGWVVARAGTTLVYIITRCNDASGDYDVLDTSTYPITGFSYSIAHAPEGFPPNPEEWTVTLTDTTNRTQSSPTQNVKYNAGSLSIVIPMGTWDVELSALIAAAAGSVTNLACRITLSTANNTESDVDFSGAAPFNGAAASDTRTYGSVTRRKILIVGSNTTYYVNIWTTATTPTEINMRNDIQSLFVRARLGFLL
jgi:hypothetical protein